MQEMQLANKNCYSFIGSTGEGALSYQKTKLLFEKVNFKGISWFTLLVH